MRSAYGAGFVCMGNYVLGEVSSYSRRGVLQARCLESKRGLSGSN